MIDFTEIKSNLEYCHNQYRFYISKDYPSSAKLAKIYCKIAIIELHGWVETTLEGICQEFVDTHTSSYKQLEKFAKKNIQRNHGIGYQRHIRPLFCLIFGFKLFQELEFKLRLTEEFSEILKSIMAYRNELAHSYVRHSTRLPSFSEPSYSLKWLSVLAQKLNEISTLIEAQDSDKKDGQTP